jgi:O-antigen/teichoic acid export membrane protein
VKPVGTPKHETTAPSPSNGADVQPGLGSRVRSGVRWKVASQVSIQLLGFATAVVVAHFLTPREVGLVAMALVFSNLALVITDAGVASALVQRTELSEEDISTAFWMSVAIGVGMTLIGIGMSWPVADLYGEPKVQPLLAAISPALLFAALGIVQGALLTRELEFRKLELRTMAATLVSTSVTMALAALGLGPWALVVQTLTITGVSTMLLWRSSGWRPRRLFSAESLRDLAPFSGHILGARTIAWGRSNVDNLLIGRYVGASRLGAYSIAFNLMVTPVTRLAGPLTQVFYPAFSRMRDPERIGEVWLRAVRLVAAIVVPAMLGLAVVAPDFIAVLFGPRWHEAAPVLRILAPLGMVLALQALNYGILQSLARTRTLFRYTLIASLIAIGSFAVGLPWGIIGVATAYAVVSLVLLEPWYLVLTARAVGVPVRSWIRSVSGVLGAGVAMAAILAAVRVGLVDAGLPPSARLIVLIVLGAGIYLPLLRWRVPELMEEVKAVRGRTQPQ